MRTVSLPQLEKVWRRAVPWLARRAVRVRTRLIALRVASWSLIRQYMPSEAQHLFALTLVVGVVCGLVAVLFHMSIRAAEMMMIERALHAPAPWGPALTMLLPVGGGLLAGAALTYLVPGARGSGIPQVKVAFATEGGRVRFRDALGKFIISSFQIGTGASLGREGPTVQICAGATTLLARLTALPPRNMRRLTPVGVAAGIAAAFNAPVAAVTFTIEEIVGNLDSAVLSGVVIAAALAAVIERSILGEHPIIEVAQRYGLDHPSSLLIYALLGMAAAVVSVAFTDSLLKMRAWFRALREVPLWARPAVGGAITGVLALGAMWGLGTTGITGGGYEALRRSLAGELGLSVLAFLCVSKLVATVASYSSGGAGGIFAPSLFVGAMLGGLFGNLDIAVFQHEQHQLGAFALVGMGAVFAGVIRAPITSVLIIFEMTGGYGLVLPLMLANMTSYLLARRLRPTGVYEALLEQDGVHLPRAVAGPHPLEQLTVADAMTPTVLTASVEDTAGDVLRALGGKSFETVPVVDASGAVKGVVTGPQLELAEPTQRVGSLARPPATIRADAQLLRAIVRMSDGAARLLCVVSPAGLLVGVLTMTDVVRAHARAADGRQPRRTDRPATLEASELMVPVAEVRGDESVEVIARRLQDVDAVIVRPGSARPGVILPEYLQDLAPDGELRRMLIAQDVARPAAAVDRHAGLANVFAAMAAAGTDVAVVFDGTAPRPLGVVSKRAMAVAYLEWSAAQATGLPGGGRDSSPPPPRSS